MQLNVSVIQLKEEYILMRMLEKCPFWVFSMLILILHGCIEYFSLEGTFVHPVVQLPPQSGAGFVII